jgi:hypothetical protein
LRTVYRIVPAGNQWELRRGQRRMSLYDSRDEAIAAGREVAQFDQPSRLIVEGSEGQVQAESTY